MEKSLLRSPELSLTGVSVSNSVSYCFKSVIVVCDFFRAYSHDLKSEEFKRVLTLALSSSKSANPLVRSGSVDLFSNITGKVANSDADLQFAVNEVLNLPKTSKTAGPDHRSALYSMIKHIPPTSSTSGVIVESIPPLVLKETHEVAMSALVSSLPLHLVHQLRSDRAPSKATLDIVVKEMNSSKPAIRRAFSSIVGDTLWSLSALETQASLSYAQAVFPALEANLKTIGANPLASSPAEGYIAIAVLLGPFARSGKFSECTPTMAARGPHLLTNHSDNLISANATIQTLNSSSPKPSFLLWDKVYQKLTDADDEVWLLRAGEVAFSYLHSELSKNNQLRYVFFA